MYARFIAWICTIRSYGLALAVGLGAFGLGAAVGAEDTATSKDSISISVNSESLTRLPSQWADYFGTHYAGTLEPFDKDLAYWTVYQIHKTFPDAWHHVAWQIGNELVSGHLDPKGVRQQGKLPEVSPDGKLHGYDLDWKKDFYVEKYLAPAVEAIERASKDVYGDSRKIKILLGSMNPYNRQNIEFLRSVMDWKFIGRRAPTLAGEPVWKHIDMLTVHYMFGGERTVQRMQGYSAVLGASHVEACSFFPTRSRPYPKHSVRRCHPGRRNARSLCCACSTESVAAAFLGLRPTPRERGSTEYRQTAVMQEIATFHESSPRSCRVLERS